jgi:MFS family permease
MARAVRGCRVARFLFALTLAVALSQFHRTALAVVAPEIARELGAGPEQLGLANGIFFIALAVGQIPVGLALDRIGPRRVVAWLSALAVLGVALQSLAQTPQQLIAARFVIGLGCSASFMASVVLAARFFSGPGLTTAIARIFALSQLGILAAAAPLAEASAVLGWRGALAAGGLLTAASGLLAAFWLRDHPPGTPPPATRETLGQALLAQARIWRTPGLFPILSMHLVGYAAVATVIGIWAGPYLADAHGLGTSGRGAVLSAMALALPAAGLLVGPIERRLNTRKRLVIGLALAAAATLATLALWRDAPLPVAVALLVTLCLCSCYPVVVVAHGRTLFADHLVGRGATTVNLAQVVGAATLPWLVGLVVGGFPETADGLRPEAAYRAGFGVLALALLLGVAGYARSRDAPPDPARLSAPRDRRAARR